MAKAKAKGRKLTTSYGQRGHEAARAQRKAGSTDVVTGAVLSVAAGATSEIGLGLALSGAGFLKLASGFEGRARARSKAAHATAVETLIQRSRGGSAALASKGVDASKTRGLTSKSQKAAPLNRGLSASQKSDYAKATQAHKAAAEKRASNKPASDGMTDAHVRTQNGKTVQVGGYRTVLPK